MVNIRRRLCPAPLWLAIFLAVQCTYLWSASDTAPHPEILVSTEWLASHLNDPKVIVLQAGEERGSYEKEHIPGARFLDDNEYTTGHQGLMIELPTVGKLRQTFEDLGVRDDTRVVIYTTEWYPTAGRAFFTLDYLGHGNTALLNGSLAKWKAENRAVTAEMPKIAKGSITPRVNESARALLDTVKAAAQPESKTLLLDSRPRKRYTEGHLAGADHIFWEETVANPKNPVFLQPEELRRLFLSRGLAPDHKVITYCEIGLQASHMYFVAKYLGYNVAMFDGSYYQWNEIEHLPVTKGGAPR
jgi:thiosulfate/3-mercaptopyruvate sulfurtransferase